MIVLDLSASGAEGLAPAGWVVRVTMPAGPPMLYAAMFSAPSDAILRKQNREARFQHNAHRNKRQDRR